MLANFLNYELSIFDLFDTLRMIIKHYKFFIFFDRVYDGKNYFPFPKKFLIAT